MTDFTVISGLFAIAVTLHNIEEALLLPSWSRSAGRWHHSVGAFEFRFAVVVLTVFAYFAVYLSIVGNKEGLGAYLLSGYALAMFLNVLFPHLLATVVMRRYAPGTVTALFFNLPITIILLRQALEEGYIHVNKFSWAEPLVVVVILVAIPLLFVIGRKVENQLNMN